MIDQEFPPGWDAERALRVAKHYEEQSDEDAIAEAEEAWHDERCAMMAIPIRLVSAVRELIARDAESS